MIIPLCAWQETGIKVARRQGDGDPVEWLLKNSDERVAIDLHIGDQFQIKWHEWLTMPQELRLKPNDCVRVRIQETITTPHNVFGQVCSKGGLSPEGLLVANQKVDPNFKGQLELAIFNAGNNSVKVKEGLPFASLWFGRLSPEPADPPERRPTPTQGIETFDLREKWHVARPYVLTGFASTVSAIAAYLILHIK